MGLKPGFIERETQDSDRLRLRIPPKYRRTKTIMDAIRMRGVLEFRQMLEGPFNSKEEALNSHGGPCQ